MGAVLEIDKFDNLKLTLGYFRQAEPEGPSYNGRVTFGNTNPGIFHIEFYILLLGHPFRSQTEHIPFLYILMRSQ